MDHKEITEIFDQQAESYDQQWSRLAPINHALYLLTSAVLTELPESANILCVGAGTGAEIFYLAERFPGWRFTAVEPSVPMLNILRHKAEEQGIASRCVFHAGFLDSLPVSDPFDAATSFLVSQFILDQNARAAFFQGIADRLSPKGILVCSDLAGDLAKQQFHDLLEVWFRLMGGNGVLREGVERMRQAYTRDVAVLPANEVREIISRGGFEAPVPFYQAGLIHAWFAQRSST